VAGVEFADAILFDIEADDREALAEFDGERQADVAQADDADVHRSEVKFQCHGWRRSPGIGALKSAGHASTKDTTVTLRRSIGMGSLAIGGSDRPRYRPATLAHILDKLYFNAPAGAEQAPLLLYVQFQNSD